MTGAAQHTAHTRTTASNITNPSCGVLVDLGGNAINAQVCWKVAFIIIIAVGIDMGLERRHHIVVFRLKDVAKKNFGLRARTEKHVVFRLKMEV